MDYVHSDAYYGETVNTTNLERILVKKGLK